MSQTTAKSQTPSRTGFSLSAHGLEVWRGETCLLRALDFHLAGGEILWLRGPNGVGKTSLLRVVLGLAHQEAGELHWCGRPRDEDRSAFLSDVAWCAHQPGLRGELSPRENLAAWRPLAGAPGPLTLQTALERVGLGARADQPCHSLSAGQNRRASLARLLLSPARLWCLDEPMTSLDSEGQALLGELLSEHCRQGGAVLASSHQALPEGCGPVRELRLSPGGLQ